MKLLAIADVLLKISHSTVEAKDYRATIGRQKCFRLPPRLKKGIQFNHYKIMPYSSPSSPSNWLIRSTAILSVITLTDPLQRYLG